MIQKGSPSAFEACEAGRLDLAAIVKMELGITSCGQMLLSLKNGDRLCVKEAAADGGTAETGGRGRHRKETRSKPPRYPTRS